MEDKIKNVSGFVSPENVAAKVKYPVYIGCKIVQATPMSYEDFARSTNKWENGQETLGDGYLVIYDDGYRSWSPKDVFERCYRPLTPREMLSVS